MKKTIKLSVLFLFAAIAGFINPIKAQDASKELNAFVKKFEAAYNKQDAKILQTMFTADATSTTSDGNVAKGAEAIVADYNGYFKDKLTLEIKPEKTTTTDGVTISSGIYHLKGTSKKGEKVDYSGGYTNTMVKENGEWKISKQVFREL